MEKKSQFNVKTVGLEASNLIEASAGTGKTFSIALLVLRLIVEKNYSLRQILMVTFTKAAVAELESRIRAFVRESFLYLNQEDVEIDSAIKTILDQACAVDSKAVVSKRIEAAQFQLDETSIFTIHSFCQKTLNEFAFETQQLFGNEVVSDLSTLVEKAINEYWRKEITGIETPLLEYLYANGLSMEGLNLVVNNGLKGKKFVYNQQLDFDNAYQTILELEKAKAFYFTKFETAFESSSERQIADISNKTVKKYVDKNFADIINDATLFFDKFLKELSIPKGAPKSLEKAFPELYYLIFLAWENNQKIEALSKDIIYYLYGKAVGKTKAFIERTKHYLSQLSFDDLIINLHQAVKGQYSDLLKYELQKKYKAVFIDEFQDTDQHQYEIFDTLFGRSSVLFYIGDPKQAIYSFRGADIDTYKLAAQNVSYAYTMSHNYRSTPDVIQSMNHFFASVDAPFLDDKIGYEEVLSGKPLEGIKLDGVVQKPLAYLECKNKGEIIEQTAYQILELLNGGNKIEERELRPSDIGVLVRNKKDGVEIQKLLRRLRIPTVTIDDTKVLLTEEAEMLMYLLMACLVPSIPNMHRALLTPLTSVTKSDIINSSIDDDILKLRQVAKEWQSKSVYSAIILFLSLYRSKDLLLEEHARGERIITNVLQIAEILHKKEIEEKLAPNALLNWFKLAVEGNAGENEAYLQRIDSDEDAVKIVTIHKSKGLAYNIVFAPFLDLKARAGSSVIEYKNQELESCFSFYKTEEEKALMELQVNQENRRLVYVALTRAVYKNYIFHSKGSKNTSITDFLEDIESNPLVEILECMDRPKQGFRNAIKQTKQNGRQFPRHIKKKWSTTSFSQLSDAHISFEDLQLSYDNTYDDFVFSKMPKGSAIGNFIHDIFENIDFTAEDHKDVILGIAQRHSAVFKAEDLDLYQALVHQVLLAYWGDSSMQLASVRSEKKIPELEFYFKLSDSKIKDIEKLFPEVSVTDQYIERGMMYGFIDLFFEHDGKYYILDWKSNFLGGDIESYSDLNVNKAMEGNNYHFQYLIYTVAVLRYLRQKIKGFDFEKHFGGVMYAFVRGLRAEKKSGTFFKKPDYILIQKLDQIL